MPVIPDHYIWFFWASAFLLPWIAVFGLFPAFRREILWASLVTAPMGLTEPLFVPAYWNPPSLFDLAQRTGFDLESLIFCFGIGGIASVLYNVVTRRTPAQVGLAERRLPRHRHHRLALVTPALVFPPLYLFPWNPIYPVVIALLAGVLATVLCRPDLLRKSWAGGLLFAGYYGLILNAMDWSSPGYIQRVWNLGALSDVFALNLPLEEWLFAIAFGLYWSGAYEHFTWRRVGPDTGNSFSRA